MLDCLQEAEISNLRGTEHELAFMERLFSWATVLKQMTVTFDESITESRDIKEFCQKLLSFSTPEAAWVLDGRPRGGKAKNSTEDTKNKDADSGADEVSRIIDGDVDDDSLDPEIDHLASQM
ncbi:hypothetical protein QYE76_013861 [Lolium multiflorum]|uniref:Uncharacterized protein n=1 Tax=Lolium multiflorum TaxID=4521 RepID=A0AAD8U3P7_LOLMU|nr:hypothetical protein QYE76_013861 [Lolium multiflorum]